MKKYKPGDLVYYFNDGTKPVCTGIVCRATHNWIQVKWFKSPYARPSARLSFYKKGYWNIVPHLEDHADYPA